MTEDELVTIPVPKRHLAAIYTFIGTLDADGGSATPAQGDEANGWTPELIRRQYVDSPESLKAFQKLLASEPGKEFSTQDVVAALSLPGWKSVAGMLGAAGHRNARYGQPHFPWQTRWGSEDRRCSR